MSKKLLYVVAIVLMAPLTAWAQNTGSITGNVTDRSTGESLTGANVFVREISRGAVTDLDGNYTISQVPAGRYTVVVTYVGYRENRFSIEVGSGAVRSDIQLEADLLGLEEVVVTGVSDATPQRKLAFTVGRVSSSDLDNAPATSAAGALQGKVAGVKVVSASGQPGGAPTIRLRGSTALIGSQQPLIIVDGVVLDGSLADINSEDIEAIEVIKGASAASLYGSRAANGVVQIITKRGQYLAEGQTQVVFRTEYGVSSITKLLDLSESHPYQVNADGSYVLVGGNRVLEADRIADNPYVNGRNLQEEMFNPGTFMTNFISLQRNTGSGNYAVSLTNNQSDGILFGSAGYGRQTFRFNVDQDITDQLKFSASTSFAQSDQEPVPQAAGSAFFNILLLQPDADIYGMNANGQKYNITADPYIAEPNPLYELYYHERDFRRTRMLADFRLAYAPLEWANFEVSYGFDRANQRNSTYIPLGTLDNISGVPTPTDGSLNKFSNNNLASMVVGTATFSRQFMNSFNTRLRLSYQYEDRSYDEFSVTGSKFTVAGLPNLGITDNESRGASSYQSQIKTENVFGLFDIDYKDKYIGSFLIRQDGSSEFGADQRYATYYRMSGAYRITEDIAIPGVQELKLRASYGTAGLRPGFSAQYETFNVSSGSPTPVALGNPDLKPARSAETELGIDMEFLNRYSMQINYAVKNTDDQIVAVPLPAKAGGFRSQVQNAGALESTTFEAQFGAILMDQNNMRWTANFNFDRTRQTVTRLDFPSRLVGPGEQSNAIFFLDEGENFGIMYGRRWVKSFDELQDNPAYAAADPNLYEVNSDGYLIAKNADGTSRIGTPTELPIRYFSVDENGMQVGDFKIGDTNPDFNFSMSNTFSWKGLSVYALIDAQVGGQLYNLTKQWTFRELRHGDFDQRGKADSEKKAVTYYQALYDANNANEYFVEDGGYLKLRELAVNYTFNRRQLGALGASIDRIRVGVVGRNLLTFTGYSGYDPEVSGVSGDASNYRIDTFNYPNFRTFTGVIEIAF